MANARLYLKCTGCGKILYVGKHFGDPWHLTGVNKIPSFMIKHNESCFFDGDDTTFKFEEENDIEDFDYDLEFR